MPSEPEPAPEVWGELAASGPVPPEEIEARVDELLAELSLEEKCAMMTGDQTLLGAIEMARHYNREPIVAGEVPRFGIPGIRFSDGPRGVVMNHSTAFPCSMARGATFDPALEERVGDAIGVECRALGANLFAGICVNVLRHPAWGRAQETYGEEPWLLGEMGVALTRGAQRHVMGCVKHFACNSMENARFRVDVRVADEDLADLYLPHFRRIVDEGVASVMSAYNKVNGDWCGHHEGLLTRTLKSEWRFDGFVMTDFVLGARNAVEAVNGGQDLEMPFRWRFRKLARSVQRGEVAESRVDDAVRRLLRQQLRFAGRGEPERYAPSVVASDEHRALAREVAERSIVLLQNDAPAGESSPLLPFSTEVRSVAVIGRLASFPNTGDHGSSWVRAPEVVTPLAGIEAAAKSRGVSIRVDDGTDAERAARAAAEADVAVVVAGYTFRDEGEYLVAYGGDRDSLTLRPRDEALIRKIASGQPKTVVALMGGSAIVTESWRRDVPALLMAWYPGMEGGHALAAILWGDVDPGGRLPCTFPARADQLPPFDRKARRAEYGPLFGYRLFEATGETPAFPFGFGLSYTTWEQDVSAAKITAEGALEVTVSVTNTGPRSGRDLVQVYVEQALGTHPAPLRTLRAAAPVDAKPGESRTVTLVIDPREVERARGSGHPIRVHVGRSSSPTDLQGIVVVGT